MKSRKLWFKARHYGWGWYPASWEGGLVLVSWLLFVLLMVRFIESEHHSGLQPAVLAVSVLVLILISWKKGERPRWRWGGQDVPAYTVLMKILVAIGAVFALLALLYYLNIL